MYLQFKHVMCIRFRFCPDEHVCCYLYIIDVHKPRPFLLYWTLFPYFLTEHQSNHKLSYNPKFGFAPSDQKIYKQHRCLVDYRTLRLLDAIVNNFGANFGALVSVLSEDSWVGSGARERRVPLRCLNHTSRPMAFLLTYPCWEITQWRVSGFGKNSVVWCGVVVFTEL